MYLPGQIVYDLDKKRPFKIGCVWDVKQYPKRHTHFVKCANERTAVKAPGGLFYELYEIATPRTVAEAKILLTRNLITPASCPPSHCWKCGHWKDVCKHEQD